MRYHSFGLLVVFTIVLLCGCKKESPSPRLPVPSFPFIPYDTTGLSGVFITSTVRPFAHFYNVAGSQNNGQATVTFLGMPLAFDSDYYFTYVLIASGNYPVQWAVSDKKSFSFSFDDSSIKPRSLVIFRDTIVQSQGLTLRTDTLKNADFIMFWTNSPDVPEPYAGMPGNIRYFQLPADSITLDSTFWTGLRPGTKINIYSATYRRQYQMINGFKYLFIKETSGWVGYNIWLK